MINYRLLAIVAITISNLVLSHGSSSSQSCLFIGCACQRERIRCPLEPNPLSMFPKRRAVIHSDKPLPRNLSIDLSSNRLEMVPDDRFADLDVHSIDLSGNQIARISPDAFRDLVRLSHLSLNANRLRFLSPSVFGPVKESLETLLLGDNQLGEMESSRLANVFLRLTNLATLDLSSNRLFDMPDLRALSRLGNLDLRGNQLESLVDVDTLESLFPLSLVELYLDDNQFKHISDSWFDSLVSLKVLSLANNQISAIAENSFRKLTALNSINLSGNMLKHIPSEIIYTLESLEILDLSSQAYPIRRIDDYAFERESHKKPIRRVLLHNNSISVIGKRAFCVRGSARSRLYANIKEIDLSQNRLESVDACVLRQLARGYSEPIYTSKMKLYTKVVLNRNRQLATDHPENLIECSCEVTKANKLLDLEGYCRHADSSTIYLNQYDCGDYSITNANQVNRICASRIETECIASSIDDSSTAPPTTSTTTITTTSTLLLEEEDLQTLPLLSTESTQITDEQLNSTSSSTISSNSSLGGELVTSSRPSEEPVDATTVSGGNDEQVGQFVTEGEREQLLSSSVVSVVVTHGSSPSSLSSTSTAAAERSFSSSVLVYGMLLLLQSCFQILFSFA